MQTTSKYFVIFAITSISVYGLYRNLQLHDPYNSSISKIVPNGMIKVPAGEFTAGTNDIDVDSDIEREHKVFLDDFAIDITEVTNADFKKFKPTHKFAPGEERLSATNILYYEADAYAKWVGKRLPTELEWEKTAHCTDGRRYPWGNVWNPQLVAKRQKGAPHVVDQTVKDGSACSIAPTRAQDVGKIPGGASPYGCLDMAGNAWEWVQGHPGGREDQRILRGGAVGYTERAFRTYNRGIEGSGVT